MVNLQKNDQPVMLEVESGGAVKKRLAFPEVIITVMIVVFALMICAKIVFSQYELAQHQPANQQPSACKLAADRGETLPEGCAK